MERLGKVKECRNGLSGEVCASVASVRTRIMVVAVSPSVNDGILLVIFYLTWGNVPLVNIQSTELITTEITNHPIAGGLQILSKIVTEDRKLTVSMATNSQQKIRITGAANVIADIAGEFSGRIGRDDLYQMRRFN